jgi:CheY-like chemotaxis protein
MSRILLVEDEPDIRALARLLLVSAGHHVIEAPDGETAMSTLGETAGFDVMLLDLRLPAASGWDVLHWMRENLPRRPPVVVFSAQIGPDEHSRAQHEGAVGYVTKPFTEADLLAAVARAAPTT